MYQENERPAKKQKTSKLQQKVAARTASGKLVDAAKQKKRCTLDCRVISHIRAIFECVVQVKILSARLEFHPACPCHKVWLARVWFASSSSSCLELVSNCWRKMAMQGLQNQFRQVQLIDCVEMISDQIRCRSGGTSQLQNSGCHSIHGERGRHAPFLRCSSPCRKRTMASRQAETLLRSLGLGVCCLHLAGFRCLNMLRGTRQVRLSFMRI